MSTKQRSGKRLLSLALTLALALSLFGGILPIPAAHAATGDLTGTFTDDGGAKMLTAAGVPVALSYGAGNSTTSNQYNAQFVMNIPANSTNISLTATLAEGMRYVNDASEGNARPPFIDGTVTKTPNAAPAGYTGASGMANTGVRVYNILDGTVSTTLDLTVALHEIFHFSTITDPITVTLSYTDALGAPVTETVKVSSAAATGLPKLIYYGSNGGTQVFPISAGASYNESTALPQTYYTLLLNTTLHSGHNVEQLTESFTANFTFSDPDVVVTSLNGTSTPVETAPGVWTATINRKAKAGVSDFCGLSVVMPSGAAVGSTITGTLSFTNNYYGGDSSTATKTINFKIAPQAEDCFVQYSTVANAAGSIPANAIYDISATSQSVYATFSGGTAQGQVGMLYIGNRGGSESVEKTVEIHFDPDAVGVTGLYLPVVAGYRLTSIDYQKEGDAAWHTATVDITANASGQADLTRNMLGLTDSEYISALRYNTGKIPATYATFNGIVYGVIKTSGEIFDFSIEVRDTDTSSTHTTGLGYFKGITSNHCVGLHYSNITASYTLNAGATEDFQVSLSTASGPTLSNNIVYLRSETGIPFTNVHVMSTVAGDITAQCAISHFTDASGADVTKIDMTAADGLSSQAGFYSGASAIQSTSLVINWSLPTTATTPDGTYSFRDMIFVDATNSNTYFDTNGVKENQHALPVSAFGTISHPNTANTYTIVGRNDVSVVTTAKSTLSTGGYFTPSVSDPVLMSNNPATGVDLNIAITNNSANSTVEPSVVYFPIPKTGDNWGKLLSDDFTTANASPFEFNIQLKGAVTDVDTSGFTVEYGVGVTPTDSGTVIAADTHFYAAGALPAGKTFADVNCIKITTTNMAAGASYNFRLSANVQDTVVADDLVNTWKPLYYQNVGNGAAYTPGETISAKTAMGELQGQIFLDAGTINGVKDGSEGLPANPASYKVRVYRKADGVMLQEIPVTAAGTYHVYTLYQDNAGTLYYLEVVNPDTANTMFTVTATQSTTNVANVFDGQGTDHATGKTGTVATYVEGDLDATHGTYNIGVAAKALTTITFSSSDATTNNTAATTQGSLTLGTEANKATVSASKLHTESLAVPTRTPATGYAFDHWATSENGTTAVTPPTTFGTTAATYWAVWKAKEYTVEYDLAGGKIGTETTVANKTGVLWGQTGLLPTGTPTKAGCTFLGWYFGTTEVAATTAYSALAANDGVNSIELKAKWRTNATLEGGTGKTLEVTKSLAGLDPATPVTFTFTITGRPGSPVPPLPTSNASVQVTTGSGTNADNHAYGLTTTNPVSISFGSITYTEPGSWSYEVKETAVTKDGLFCDNSRYDITVVVEANAANTALTARVTYFKRTFSTLADPLEKTVDATKLAFDNDYRLYTVNYDLAGGKLGTDTAVTPKTGVLWAGTGLLPSGTPVKAGSTFAGWKSGAKTVTGTSKYSDLATDYTDMSIDVVAQWTEKDYTVTYDLAGGKIGTDTTVANKTGVKWDNDDLLPAGTPEKTGFDFAGWKYGAKTATTASKYSSLAAGDTVMSIELVAQWTAKTYTVTYNLDGGNVGGALTIASRTGVLWGGTGLLPAGTPAKDGAVFVGWLYNTTEVSATTAYSALAANDGVNSIELKAKWRTNATLTDGTTGMSDITKTLTGVDPATPTPPATKPAFTFKIDAVSVTGAPAGTAVPMPANTEYTVSTATGTDTATAVYGLTVAASKNINIGDISFVQPGTYTYTISETQGTALGVDYDGTEYTMTVVVAANTENTTLSINSVTFAKTKDADGTALTTPTAATALDFTNDYTPTSANPYDVAAVNKTVTGTLPATATAKTFSFTLEATSTTATGLTAATMPLPQESGADNTTAGTTGAGTDTFGSITFTKAGSYVYTIKEDTATAIKGYTFDPVKYTLTVTVADNAGKLTVTSAVYTAERAQVVDANGNELLPAITAGTPAASVSFNNLYTPVKTDPALMVDPPVKKTLSGDRPEGGGVFKFNLKAVSTTAAGLDRTTMPLPAGSSIYGVKELTIFGAGTSDFGVWSYTKAGTYVYTVNEVHLGQANFTYDSAVYTITDVVSDNDGQLELARTVTNNSGNAVTGCVFNNNYTDPKNPHTDDSANIGLWAGLMALALAGGTATLVIGGKRRKKTK